MLIKKLLSSCMAAVLVLASTAVPMTASASETEYAITSSLNGGWQNTAVERKLIASAQFGKNPVMNGMTAEIGDDPSAVTVSRLLGREGWVLDPDLGESARFININIDNSVAYDCVDGASYAVEVDYYDKGISSLAFEYPSMDYTPIIHVDASGETSQPVLNKDVKTSEGEYLVFADTGVWRSYCWFMDNPTMADSLNGFDMRIGVYSDTMGYSRDAEVVISAVRVYRLSTASRVKITNNTSEHMGNIFYDGEEIELTADFAADIYPHYTQIDGDYPLDVVYTVRDDEGNTVKTMTDSFTLPALESETRTQKFSIDRFGIYRVDIEAYCNEKKIYSRLGTEFSYVHSDKGKTINSAAGTQIGLLNPDDVKIAQLVRNAGMENIRMMCYYYNWRKSAENYEITNVSVSEGYKSMYRAFKKAGLKINANIHSASWMGAAYNFGVNERTPPYTENGLRRWSDYCRDMAELLGDTVEVMEIWNEYNLGPNHSFNMENRPAEDYIKLYEASKAAIKSVNPDMPVVGMNTSGAGTVWIDNAIKNSGGKRIDMDIITIHPYQWYGDPLTFKPHEKVKETAAVLKKYDMDDIPLWIGEYGYSAHYEQVNTEIQQAMYNAQSYGLIMATGVPERFYFYCLLDKANPIRTDRESNFGMVRCTFNKPLPYMLDYAAKPGYLVISNLNMLYHDARFENSIELGETGRIIRTSHPKDKTQRAMMFSNKKDGETVTLNLGTDKIKLYDAYGNSEEITGEKGIYSFTLSERVQYIEGNFTSFDRVLGGVYPKSSSFDVPYGENAVIQLANYTGKTVTARVKPMFGSEAGASETEIQGESGTVEISGANAVRGTERVRLTLFDEENVYFCGFVYLNYKESAELTTTLIPLENGWSMRCTVENLSSTQSQKGRLTILTPEEWNIPDKLITLEAGEKKTEDILLPVALTADDEIIEAAFVTDESTKMGSYVSRSYNFSAALRAKTPITIDGYGNEWTEGFINLNKSSQFSSLISLGSTYAGADDLSARAAVKWDDENFYFYADVVDNKHFSMGVEPVNIWQMDSIQLALVYDPKNELQRTEFEEMALGELNGEPILYRHKTRFKGDEDYTKIPGAELKVRVDGLHTYYEMKAPWSSLMVDKVTIEPGTELKFSMIVNENDGVGRVGYLALSEGIASSKNSNLFKRLYIRN
ncbi:MAG: cellulase family glycosylhydrolase [Clostridia bacterium]|nr:cellulase family glycosylhydrolase [Clostridia bacterium]